MIDDFFDDHPGLGFVFDFDNDGDMSLGEAMAMGAMFGILDEELNGEDDEFDDDGWSNYGF